MRRFFITSPGNNRRHNINKLWINKLRVFSYLPDFETLVWFITRFRVGNLRKLTEFKTALQHSKLIQTETRLSTGSPELDKLINMIQNGLFYLFYGEKKLIELLFRHMTTQALKQNQKGAPKVAYMLLGNYRKERTNLGIEELAELVEDSGFHMWEALSRVRIFTASSADQQALLINELMDLLDKEDNVSLVIVRGIFKLHIDDARIRNRHEVWEEVQKSIINLAQLCAHRNIPLVASGREIKLKGKLLPQPESSSFLRHTANVIINLRRRQKDSKYNRAFLIDHPLKPLGSVEYAFKVNEKLGRETKPFRQSYQELVHRINKEFKEALISRKRKNGFELLLAAMDSELGAMSYAESFKMLDLMLLVSVIEVRSLITDIQKEQEIIQFKLNRVLEG